MCLFPKLSAYGLVTLFPSFPSRHVDRAVWTIPFPLGWGRDTHARIVKPLVETLQQEVTNNSY